MRFREFFKEQTIGTIGSTTGTPTPVSQTPSSSTTKTGQEKTDPNREQLAKLLMPHGISEPEDLNNASAALQKAMTSPAQLDAQQQELLGKLVNPMLKNQGFALALKSLAAQKPGVPTPAGTQSPTTPPGKTI
jgi:hypothetical protein